MCIVDVSPMNARQMYITFAQVEDTIGAMQQISPFGFGAGTGAAIQFLSQILPLQLELNPLGHYWATFLDFRH